MELQRFRVTDFRSAATVAKLTDAPATSVPCIADKVLPKRTGWDM
jgi:hypothetical protein